MDFKKLAENLGLETDEYAELVELFVDTGKPQVVDLRDAVKAENREGIHKIAHSLKGASGNLGLMEISQVSKKIEDDCVSMNFQAVAESIEKINELIDALSAASQSSLA